MPFNFCPKRDASFWENGSELKRFVLELQTGGFADYTIERAKERDIFFHSVNLFLKQYDLQQLNKQYIPHKSSSVPKQKKT